jgi:hypothetical protein
MEASSYGGSLRGQLDHIREEHPLLTPAERIATLFGALVACPRCQERTDPETVPCALCQFETRTTIEDTR